MGMFLNYENIESNYVPNNLVRSYGIGKSYTKLDPIQASKPYEEYNSKGELIGYSWRYGESINLEFNIDGEVTVETNALVFTREGQKPSELEGALGLRAYNVVDKFSWTCVNIVDGRFVWRQDSEFVYDCMSTRSIYVDASDYLADKHVVVSIYNFRHELIQRKTFSGKTQIVYSIDAEESKKLNRGIYYCSLRVVNDSVDLCLFDEQDCVLLIK